MLTPDASRSDRTWPIAKDRLGWIAVGVVVIIVVGIVVFMVNQRAKPADVVRDYLTAVSERDVESALEFIDAEAEGTFLTPASIADGWRVSEVSVRDDGGDSYATVDAKITGPAGSQAGVFDVRDDGDGWRITNPFVTLEFSESSFTYQEINGQKSSYGTAANSSGFRVFPGAYRFFESTRDRVTAGASAVVVMPDSDTSVSEQEISVRPRLTAKGLVAVQNEVRRRVTQCATYTMLFAPNCPFGRVSSDSLTGSNGDRLDDIQDIRWTVINQPTVAAGVAISKDGDEAAATVSVPKPGQARLTATGYSEEARGRLPVTVTCGIDPIGRVAFAIDGSISIEYGQLIPPASADPRTECR